MVAGCCIETLKTKNMNRRSDIIFFGTLIIVMVIMMFFILFGIEIPNYFPFWWIVLVPMALSKALCPNSKFTKWLNGEVFKK